MVFCLLFIFLLAFGYYYFSNNIVNSNSANQNLLGDNLGLINQEAEIEWQTYQHSQAGYGLMIPADWHKKEIGNDLIISSYNIDGKITPEKNAKLEIQLVANPGEQNPDDWWADLLAAGNKQDYTKDKQTITINGRDGLKRILEEPSSNPLDLDYFIFVNENKIIYIFKVTTQGYAKKDYQNILNEVILSFKFPINNQPPINLPTNNATTSPATLSQLNASYNGWLLYQNIELGFQIEYPPDWHIYSEGEIKEVSGLWQIIFEDQKYQGQEIDRPYVALSVLGAQNNLLNWFNGQKADLEGVNLLYNENYKLNDLDGIMYSTGGMGINYNFATFFDNKIYRIWNLNFFPADDTMMIYFKMLDSFRLLPVT